MIIQTYTPDHYAIDAAAQHDYAAFFAREIELRREQAYPPFIRLARLVYSPHVTRSRASAGDAAWRSSSATTIATRGLPASRCMGPAPPHIPKWHGRYRWQIRCARRPSPQSYCAT